MIPIDTILTHPGGAHKDEFLACSVLLALHPVPVVRREPKPEDLASTSVCVVDVGHRHEPERNNFDHHQLPKDHPPTCSLSLVLQHLDLYEDARQFCDWLETAEWFDCRGLVTTAQWLGTEPAVVSKLISPIDVTLLRRFALVKRIEPGQPLWEVMRLIGEDLLDYVKTMRLRLDAIGQQASIWDLEFDGQPAKILFLPRTDPLPDDPALGVEQYITSPAQHRLWHVAPPGQSASGFHAPGPVPRCAFHARPRLRRQDLGRGDRPAEGIGHPGRSMRSSLTTN
jgi:hypothetical protein